MACSKLWIDTADSQAASCDFLTIKLLLAMVMFSKNSIERARKTGRLASFPEQMCGRASKKRCRRSTKVLGMLPRRLASEDKRSYAGQNHFCSPGLGFGVFCCIGYGQDYALYVIAFLY